MRWRELGIMQSNKSYRVGFGPMSLQVIDSLAEYSDKEHPLMIIASRNQVDYTGSYVMVTEALKSRLSGTTNLMLCRDHCGPYFKDSDSGLSLEQALDECYKTIQTDIANGFELIHVDVSRIPNKKDRLPIAKKLIDRALDINPGVIFEFGTEENIGLASDQTGLIEQLDFLEQYRENVKYVVTQTGSLTKHTQVGKFDPIMVRKLSDIIHARGFLLKEHNADYLSSDQVAEHFSAGVDAMNVAPQLGVAQTHMTWMACRNAGLNKEWHDFVEVVISAGKWKKWLGLHACPGDEVLSAGHYHFNTEQYKKILNSLGLDFGKQLNATIRDICNTYCEI